MCGLCTVRGAWPLSPIPAHAAAMPAHLAVGLPPTIAEDPRAPTNRLRSSTPPAAPRRRDLIECHPLSQEDEIGTRSATAAGVLSTTTMPAFRRPTTRTRLELVPEIQCRPASPGQGVGGVCARQIILCIHRLCFIRTRLTMPSWVPPAFRVSRCTHHVKSEISVERRFS